MDLNVAKEAVIQGLKNYHSLENKRAVLKHELLFPNQVSDIEVLESMNYAKNADTGPVCASSSSYKTERIAMQYHEVASDMNEAVRSEIARRLVSVEREISRLDCYMSTLRPEEREVARSCYIDGNSIQATAERMRITKWIVRKLKDSSLETMAEMYSFLVDGS